MTQFFVKFTKIIHQCINKWLQFNNQYLLIIVMSKGWEYATLTKRTKRKCTVVEKANWPVHPMKTFSFDIVIDLGELLMVYVSVNKYIFY